LVRNVVFRLYGSYSENSKTEAMGLPRLVDAHIEGHAAILIPDPADVDTRRRLILQLDDLALRRCCVGRKCHKHVSTDALLYRDPRTRILLVAAKHRVYRQLRNVGYFLNLIRDLIAHTGSDQRLRAKISSGRVCSLGLRRFTED